MTPTHTRSASGRCRKTPAAGGAQGCVTFPCLPALSASRAEPAPRAKRVCLNSRPAPAGRAFLRHRSSMAERPAHNGLVAGSIPAGATIEPPFRQRPEGAAVSAAVGLHASGLGYPGRAHPEGIRSGAPRPALNPSQHRGIVPERAEAGPQATAFSVVVAPCAMQGDETPLHLSAEAA